MLPARFRLDRSGFAINRKKPFLKKTTPFLKYQVSRADIPHIKLAFVVPKKLSKKAVVRNRTKRLLSEIFYHFVPSLKRGFYIVVYAQKIFPSRGPDHFYPIIEKDLKELGLL